MTKVYSGLNTQPEIQILNILQILNSVSTHLDWLWVVYKVLKNCMYFSFLAILRTRKKIHGLLLGSDYYQLLTYNFYPKLPSPEVEWSKLCKKKGNLTSWVCTMFHVSRTDIGAHGHVLHSILFLLCSMFKVTFVRPYSNTQKQS